MSLIDTKFRVDESKCVGCGLCQLACPSMLIEMNEHKKPGLKPVKSMDWYGFILRTGMMHSMLQRMNMRNP